MNGDPGDSRTCRSCQGAGEAPTDYGVIDCPDCGGAGLLPTRAVLVDWRSRDIERAVAGGNGAQPQDVRWLLAELRSARTALTEIIALAHDADDPDLIALKIRFTANGALGIYDVASDLPPRAGRPAAAAPTEH